MLDTMTFWIVTAAIVCGALLDLCFGDPPWLYHPVIWIGRMIDVLQKPVHRMFPKSPMGQVMAGGYLVAILLFDTIAFFGGICALGFFLHPALGFFFETLWCAQSLALRGLMDAGKKVRDALPEGSGETSEAAANGDRSGRKEMKEPPEGSGEPSEAAANADRSGRKKMKELPEAAAEAKGFDREEIKEPPEASDDALTAARLAVGEIVGRDTQKLDQAGIIRAAVETIAENASDGVCAPLFYMMIGGAPAAFVYKTINTMDSMIGYKNRKYFYFGKIAARLDDVANLIPSRLTAVCMMLAAAFLPGYDGKAACEVWWRDRYTQASPNAAQTESVMAGALGIELLGDASYFGEIVHKPTIGNATRACEAGDIDRANRLIFAASVIFFAAGLAARIGLMLFLSGR